MPCSQDPRFAAPPRVATRGYILILAFVISLLSSFTAAAAVSGYYTQGGKIFDASSQEIQLRGVSHYGFNADILQPQYLWQMGWKEQIAQIKSLGFNAVRLPFVPDTLYVTTKVDQLSYVDAAKNPDLLGKTPLQVLDLWMAEADRQGLYVLMDFHSVSKQSQYPTWFLENPSDFGKIWNGQAYPEAFWLRDLKFVAQRYAHLQRFIGIDVYNEPNGSVRWSTGDANVTNPKYFWKAAVEKAAAGILQSNPKLLIFAQGITGNWDGVENSGIPMNWGENFQPQAYQPLTVPAGKLVLSPHTYGPDVFVKSSFSAPNYPANLAAHWETLFGQFASQHPVVVGEWGGRYGQGGVGQADVAWQNAFVDYLLSKGIRSSFYWCYTPNSGDSGGILDDNLNVRQDKMTLLRRHWGSAPAGASTLALTASSYSVAQASGGVTLSVARTGGSSGAINLQYATADGSAKSGTDYVWSVGTLAWANGDASSKSLTVPISKATPFAGSRNFTLRLSNPGGGASLGAISSATVTINGSAAAGTGPGTLALSAATYTVSQAGGLVSITVKRSGGSTGAVSIRYATANGTAKSIFDYTGKSGVLQWANGDASDKSFSVAVRNLIPFSGSRSFSVSLTTASGGALQGNPMTATVTINGSRKVATPTPTPSPAYPQPYIMSFSPAAGRVGTVVTLNGTGFAGLTTAWVGNARNVPVTVLSDTQVRVTIPAGATTGAIGLFNPSHVSFTASSFTVQ